MSVATQDVAGQLELHRRELTGYCYRMLGSPFEAEDAVQETMLRAWKAIDRFEGRSALRSWLYRIATNVCLDMLNGKERRIRPLELGDPLGEFAWVQPIADAKIAPDGGDPAQLAEERETLKLAFVAALQHLPPQQRAVLILREALRWRANEVAELLETSVASVNSALQRARATLEANDVSAEATPSAESADAELLARYVDAFERYDMEALTALIHEDATQSMPPFALWLDGREDIAAWHVGPGHECRDSRLVPLAVNGSPAFAAYKPAPDGSHRPFSVQVLDLAGDKIARITYFLDTSLFERFGLPPKL